MINNLEKVDLFESFKLELSNELQGDMGELIFKHYCFKNKFAIIRLEKIFKTFRRDNKLEFKYKNQLISVGIPDDIADEVWSISRPSNGKNEKPTYVFDYLTVNIEHYFDEKNGVFIRNKTHFYTKAFAWSEVKTGISHLTENQLALKKRSKIPIKVFRVTSNFPRTFEIKYENRDEFIKIND